MNFAEDIFKMLEFNGLVVLVLTNPCEDEATRKPLSINSVPERIDDRHIFINIVYFVLIWNDHKTDWITNNHCINL